MGNMVVDLRTANQAYITGDWVQATRLFTAIIDNDPDNVDALHQFGRLCHDAGRTTEAVDLFHRAIHLGHPSQTSHYRLSLVAALTSENKIPEALAECERARDELPDETVELLMLQSDAFYRLGDLEAATRCLEDATSDRFEPCIKATLGLAELYHRQADHERASAIFERVLELDARNVCALLRLTELMLEQEVPVGNAWIQRIHTALPFAEDDLHRVRLRFALGQVLDRRGEESAAMAAYRLANRDQATRLARRGKGFDLEAFERLVAQTCETVDRELIASFSACGNDSSLPVFIVGAPGSGQRELSADLCQDRGFAVWESAPVFDTLAKKLLGESGEYPRDFASANATDLERLASGYVEQLIEFAPAASHVINPRPANGAYLGLIKVLFPQAKIFHCVRDREKAARDAFCQARPFDLIAAPELDTLVRAQETLDIALQHWHQEIADLEVWSYPSESS